jgi:uncharacterized protein YjiS (DUF1127 family)
MIRMSKSKPSISPLARQEKAMMSTTERAHAPLHPRSVIARRAGDLLQLIGDAFAAWRSWQERQATIRDLRAWDDRMLKDIGLTRGEIIAAVDGQLQRGGCGRPHQATERRGARPRS